MKCKYCESLEKEIRECGCNDLKPLPEPEPEDEVNYVIEDGIPIPATPISYFEILSSLKIGQSVFFPKRTKANFSHVWERLQKNGHHFITRRMEGGIRIWRWNAGPAAVETPATTGTAAVARGHR